MESEGGGRTSRRRGQGGGVVAEQHRGGSGGGGGGGGREVAPLQVMLSQQVEAEVAHKLKTLEEQRHQKLWMAQRWREYAQRNLEHTYASQVQQAQDEYEFERQELLERLSGSQSGGRAAKGGRAGQRGAANGAAGLGRGFDDGRRRRRRCQRAAAGQAAEAQPPLISYTLTDDEIVEDLNIICNRLSAFSNDMKKTMFQEALGYPPAPSLPPPNNYPPASPPPSSSSTSSPSSSTTLLPNNSTSPFSPSASPPRTSAFAHKLTTPQQRGDPFAAPS
ncbi:uncharacterized protein ACA1_135660 [Acanthamoeba castellanii str. Neff]|uniref:Uncharacterized protein n=1 Tax=Acanthamoeba castellanii (strain ATCC 30010 / Neff) TaxID=1257118 RepID=L8GED4_ACACF|nr:uncharacterized protein ACA1_135660 [Acanthamoeba castellanii str. Neff]ELR11387.1 hypothetical protein ACA1_135660 [Acanthamoeba castellanii str. Neff]